MLPAKPAGIDLSLVMPFYNESARLSLTESGLCAFAEANEKYTYEIILVDDGSTDGTRAALGDLKRRQLARGREGLCDARLIEPAAHRGKGSALRAGVLESRGNWVLTLDADMATGPAELFRWEECGGIDLKPCMDDEPYVYIGSREHPDAEVQDFFHRRVLGRLFNAFVRRVSSLEYMDTQCGFKLYPRAVAVAVFSDLRDSGWAHDIEILLRLKADGITVKEMPVRWRAIEGGVHTLRFLSRGPGIVAAVLRSVANAAATGCSAGRNASGRRS